ncbi:hypothetical protein PR048_023393 [Dryococelus australis]|uniref:Uncharacterized protein n=1 Tax=Dryococelus australis TaxID=614101 RepID=A0ABQ9GU13_9NEOP|nr:hypothetical protein PR048_023393 [Dryococelus australis]
MYGNRVTVYTDSQPLVMLMKKCMVQIKNARLKRLMLKLLMYNLDVRYLPGAKMYVAYMLSQNFTLRTEKDDEVMKNVVHVVGMAEVMFSEDRYQHYVEQTYRAAHLGKVLHYVQNVLPSNMEEGGELRHYYNIRHEIYIKNGLVYFNDSDVGVSPAQILMSRQLRTWLPLKQKLLVPTIKDIRKELGRGKIVSKQKYDVTAGKEKEFHKGS